MKIIRSLNLILAMLLFSVGVLAQTTQHTVKKGETITQIAEKYRVTPYDIYRLNPDSQNGIKENDVLLIPGSSAPKTTSQSATAKPATHLVKPKETLYSISKMYGVTVDDLKNANPSLAQGLKSGQVIKIPGGTATVSQMAETAPEPKANAAKPKPTPAPAKPSNTVSNTANTGAITYHVVEPKETKFGIAKKYGITVAELERRNPGIESNLPVGYKLFIGRSGALATKAQKPEGKVYDMGATSSDKTEIVKTTKKTPYANYEVKPKETMFSLTQMFDITEAELIALNPMLKDGVKTGMILKVPGKGSIIMEEIRENKPVTDLSASVSKDKKQLVMLLPFNASRIYGDSLKPMNSRLKSDSFLNMTLDFYAGALMAIDSAKTLGLNVDVKIFDSEESKASSKVSEIVSAQNLKNADAIIGPFYQQYAEKVAELVGDVPVISPMSKESAKTYPNLFQSMPSTEAGKVAIMDFLVSKGGNIIVVNDPKRGANRDFITKNYPQARLVELDESGNLAPDKLKAMLEAGKMNYVVLDSERTGMILATTNLLLNEMAAHQLQLVILEPNETLDFEEISMKRLTILKLLYPSVTRENTSPEAQRFEAAFKKENKIFPSQYAVRGFDVTFDTLLRLSQDQPFNDTAATSTEQIESRFDYAKNEEGYLNKGIYILQYNEDLSVTQAN
jgi:LysM repeat protein